VKGTKSENLPVSSLPVLKPGQKLYLEYFSPDSQQPFYFDVERQTSQWEKP
jgi:hypothetical protein